MDLCLFCRRKWSAARLNDWAPSSIWGYEAGWEGWISRAEWMLNFQWIQHPIPCWEKQPSCSAGRTLVSTDGYCICLKDSITFPSSHPVGFIFCLSFYISSALKSHPMVSNCRKISPRSCLRNQLMFDTNSLLMSPEHSENLTLVALNLLTVTCLLNQR